MGISLAWFKLAALAIGHALGLSEREMPEKKWVYRCQCGRKYETPGGVAACKERGHSD